MPAGTSGFQAATMSYVSIRATGPARSGTGRPSRAPARRFLEAGMVRGWGIAVARKGAIVAAVFGVGAAQAQFTLPPEAPPQPPSAETPELKPPPSPVIVVRAKASLAACKKLGGVRAVVEVAGRTGLPAYDTVLVELKEKTLDAGGTHLLLIETISGTFEAKGTGEAYSCEPGRGPLPVLPKH